MNTARWGKKAQNKVKACLEPNDNGYFSIAADGGKYWTFGTSKGRYGEYAKWNGTFFSVNDWGYIYAKAGTPKGDKFVEMLEKLLENMQDRRKLN